MTTAELVKRSKSKGSNIYALDRQETLAILKKVAPALASRDLIPTFACFCFTDKTVFAYDDVVALEFPADLKIRGAVRGSLLLDFLTASKSKGLMIESKATKAEDDKATGYEITIKAGRAKLTTTALPEADFLFQRPDVKKATERKLDAAFLSALTQASVSLGRDPSHPWRMGITVVFTDGGTLMFASDNKTAVRVIVGKPGSDIGDANVTILPPRFVELMTDIGKSDEPLKLYLAKEWAEVRFKSGLRLFSRTISGADLDTFRGLFADSTKAKGIVEVPEGLDRCLKKALTVIPYSKDPFTKIKVESGKMRFRTESAAGLVTDSIEIHNSHPDTVSEVSPELLTRGLPYSTKIAVMDDRVVFTGPGFTYLVSSVQRQGQEIEEKAE